jgi:hypothetical protein
MADGQGAVQPGQKVGKPVEALDIAVQGNAAGFGGEGSQSGGNLALGVGQGGVQEHVYGPDAGGGGQGLVDVGEGVEGLRPRTNPPSVIVTAPIRSSRNVRTAWRKWQYPGTYQYPIRYTSPYGSNPATRHLFVPGLIVQFYLPLFGDGPC